MDNSRAFINYDNRFDPPDDDQPETEEGEINSLRDVADAVMADYELSDPDSVVADRIARRLYKDTNCGITFYCPENGDHVIVAGYCEGDVGDCEAISLEFPFAADELWEAVEQADKDGCDLWDATHGCEHCYDGMYDDEPHPIDPDCTECGGEGIII